MIYLYKFQKNFLFLLLRNLKKITGMRRIAFHWLLVFMVFQVWSQHVKDFRRLPVLPVKNIQTNVTVKVLDSIVDFNYDYNLQSYVPYSNYEVISRVPGAQYLVQEAVYSLFNTSTSSYNPLLFMKYQYFNNQPDAQIKKYLEKPWNSDTQQWDDTSYYVSYTGFVNHFFGFEIYDTLISSHYDFSNNTFINGEKYILTTINDSLIDKIFYYILNTSNNTFELFVKIELSYNANNLPLHLIWFIYDINTQTFSNFSKEIYTYNTQNKVIEVLEQIWSGTTWINSTRTLYTYNSQQLLVTEISQNWDNVLNQWINAEKTEYTYNAQNLVTSEYSYGFDTNTSSWIPAWGYTYDYDLNGNQTEFIFYTSDGINFIPSHKYNYSYNSQNQKIEQIYSYWDNFANVFMPHHKYEYFYTAELTDSTYYWWWNSFTNEWILATKTIYTYDADNDPLLIQDFSFDPVAQTWIPFNFKRQWFYSLLDVTATVNWQRSSVKVYPNPATDIIYFEVDDISSILYIHLFDVNGKIVLTAEKPVQNNLQIQHLRPGKYLVQIVDKNQVITQTHFLKF